MPAQDLKILYSGASGGFVVLHYLLLTRKYQIDIINHQPLEEIIEHQWAVRFPGKWKSKELWPDNSQTDLLPSPRLYFFCGFNNTIGHFPGDNLVVYTDISSQIKLAQYKNANWFCSTSFYGDARRVYRNWQQHYQKIKDSTWPACASWRKLNQLPKDIYNEIVSNDHHKQFIDYEQSLKSRTFGRSTATSESIKISNSVDYQGRSIAKEAKNLINVAKYSILLQDFINSNGQELLDLLDLGTVSDEQIQLLNHWKSLHPKELLEQIGIRT